jgi:hypothetical protein
MWVRTRPEFLFAPLAALFLAVNVGPWGFGPVYALNFALYLTLQRSNQIFPLTWSMSVGLFVWALLYLNRYRPLNWWRSFLVAGTLPFAAVSLFEIPCDLAYAFAYPPVATIGFDMISITTWLTLGFTGIGWWKTSGTYWAMLAAFLGGFLLWFGIGFPTIDTATGSALGLAYTFNVALKIACFPLAAFPLWLGIRNWTGTRGSNEFSLSRPGPVPPERS